MKIFKKIIIKSLKIILILFILVTVLLYFKSIKSCEFRPVESGFLKTNEIYPINEKNTHSVNKAQILPIDNTNYLYNNVYYIEFYGNTTYTLPPAYINQNANYIIFFNEGLGGVGALYRDYIRFNLNNNRVEFRNDSTVYAYANFVNNGYDWYIGSWYLSNGNELGDLYIYTPFYIDSRLFNGSETVMITFCKIYEYLDVDHMHIFDFGSIASYYYGLDAQLYYNNGLDAGISRVTDTPNDFGLWNMRQYEEYGQERYSAGISAGIATGENNIRGNPNNYGLYTQAQYESYGETQRQDGINEGASSNINTQWLRNIFTVIIDFANIELFPGIRISYLIGIPFIFAVVRMILKWFS